MEHQQVGDVPSLLRPEPHSARKPVVAVHQIRRIDVENLDHTFGELLDPVDHVTDRSRFGRARIDVEGIFDDRPATLHWAQLSDEAAAEPAFRFKYFQQLEGYLALPDGFIPTRLQVTLESGSKRDPVQRSYGWDTLLSESSD